MCSTCILLPFFKFSIVFFKYVFKKALSGDFIPITKDFSLLTICELIGSRTKIIRPYMHVVVQKMDGTIHHINHYSVDQYQGNLSSEQPYPALNNWRQLIRWYSWVEKWWSKYTRLRTNCTFFTKAIVDIVLIKFPYVYLEYRDG